MMANRMTYPVVTRDMVHLDPYGEPETVEVEVGEHTCKLVLRVWDGRASYDLDASTLAGDVAIDEVEPAWEAVQPNASQVRTMVLVSDSGSEFVVVKWRVDW